MHTRPATSETQDHQSINYDAYPDESGHFGPYGGKFVPETLMPALDELEEAYLKAVGDRDFLEELAYLQRTYVGQTHADHLCPPAERTSGRRTDLPQTRRPGAHRRTQDQQCAGPGPADEAQNGQDAHRGRNRGRSARRRHRHCGRAARHRMRRLHGHRGHGAPGAKRLSHAPCSARMSAASSPAARRSRTPSTRPSATGSRTCAPRTTCLAAPWARTRIRSWCATSRASSAARRSCKCATETMALAACRMRSWPASAAAATPSASSIRFSSTNRCDSSAWKPAATASRAAHMPPALPIPELGRLGVLQGTKSFVLQDGDGQIALTHSISAGLDYASVGPEHAWLRDLGRTDYTYCTDDAGHGGLPTAVRAGGHHPGAGKRPRHRPCNRAGPADVIRRRSSWST